MMVVQLIAGVPPWLYWVAYFSYFSIIATVGSLVWTIMLCFSTFGGVNPLFIFLMLLLSYTHCFFTAVMWATVMNTKEQASSASGIILMISLLPLFSSSLPVESLPGYAAYITGLLPNFSLVFWANAVTMLKIEGNPWTWDDSFTRVPSQEFLAGEQFGIKKMPPAGNLFLLFFVQTALWGALAYWLNQTYRAEYGVAKHPCFCFFCRRRAQYPLSPPAPTVVDESPPNSAAAWSAPALQISKLTKTFLRGGRRCLCLNKGCEVQRAVDDLSLDVQKGELFALLGHNGAGKTTAINCVSGMLPPTSGEVYIMGINLATNPVTCQWNLSVCPQDNPLYEELSVDEHLRYFSTLRGATEASAEKEASEALEALGLTEKRIAHCSKLN
jgi:ABC-type multidrug transport system fused ATPase/permease subunit